MGQYPATHTSVVWYDSVSGEVVVGNKHRYFHIFDEGDKEFWIGLRKTTVGAKWSKKVCPSTQNSLML